MSDSPSHFKLKPITRDGVDAALGKAERYRLLNEPREAVSICLDVLEVTPDDERAEVIRILALTDLFAVDGPSAHFGEAREGVARLRSAYDRHFYEGIVFERRAKAVLATGAPSCGPIAFDGLRTAMDYFERAESQRPAGNDDAILRWNACARLIMSRRELKPEASEDFIPFLE